MELEGLQVEDEKEEEENEQENTVKSSAIYVRVFGSEFLPFTGDDRSQLSRMFSNTFAVSSKTTLGDVHAHACKFWGLGENEYALY